MHTITLANETLILLPERAIYWPRCETLLLADLHWGKAATFRAAGIAMPGGTTTNDLARLSQIIERWHARRVVLLGDLIHAKQGRAAQTFDAISAWRKQHANIELLLVRGNHDRRAGDPPVEWNMAVVDAPHHEAPFVFQHHPEPFEGGYVLAGHIHPGVVLRGAGRQQLKLPCFWFGPHVGVLPSFGSFTGSATVEPAPGDQVFVVTDDEVLRVA